MNKEEIIESIRDLHGKRKLHLKSSNDRKKALIEIEEQLPTFKHVQELAAELKKAKLRQLEQECQNSSLYMDAYNSLLDAREAVKAIDDSMSEMLIKMYAFKTKKLYVHVDEYDKESVNRIIKIEATLGGKIDIKPEQTNLDLEVADEA